MRTNKTNAYIAVISIAIICVLSSILIYVIVNTSSTNVVTQALPTEKATLEVVKTQTPKVTTSPTSTPMPQIPQKPKYIFYIIGDGMGFSHLALGSGYEKILHQDSSYLPYWDRFDVKLSCEGGIESAKGGTMIATGYDGDQLVISKDEKGNDLVTILDRAHEAGFSTGVISNSYITDATTATFLSHVDKRSEYESIVSQIPLSNVDYIASGGLNHFLDSSYRQEFGKYDIRDMEYIYKGEKGAVDKFYDNGYFAYLGKDAAEFANHDYISVFSKEKLFMLYVSQNMSYQYNKYGSRKKEKEVHEPDLDDMTRIGIELLSRGENGFVFVIEEALIDKASHNLWMRYVSTEMHMMNKTLEAVYEFYIKHPNETLIIFTSDHETGDFSYNNDFVDGLSELQDIDWHRDSEDLGRFLKDEWNLSLDISDIIERKDLAEASIWESEEKNYTYLHSYIVSELFEANGITINSKYHSRQQVPLYTHGVKSEYFSDCTSIHEISPIVCEIMGWDSLPDVID